MVLAKV